jgi:hemoglobin
MTGRTTDGTWELGVRRATPLPLNVVWQGLVEDPVALLGVPIVLEEGAEGTADGVEVRVRSVASRVVTRMSWLEPGWTEASTLELRVLTAVTGTTVEVHHEGLPDEEARVRLLARWTARLESWLERLDGTEVPTLHAWAGGDAALRRLIDRFYDRVEADELLTGFFPGGVSEDHRDHVAAWWSEVFGGPDRYTRELGGYEAMLAHHRDLGITPEQRHRFAATLSLAADDAGLPDDPEFRAALLAYVEWGTRLAMHNSRPGATDVAEHAPVPRWGWGVAPPYRP